MADDPLSPPSGGEKGKKPSKKQKYWLYGGGVAALVVVYYLYQAHQNAAATAATTSTTPASDTVDPNSPTGETYGEEASALDSGTATGASGDPFQGIDPSTGQTYASELEAAVSGAGSSGGLSAIDPNSPTGSTYGSEIDTLTTEVQTLTQDVSGIAGSLTPGGGTGSGGNGSGGSTSGGAASATLTAWKQSAVNALTNNGVSSADASQAIAAYLSGTPITNAKAAEDLTNVVGDIGGAPTTGGSSLKVIVSSGAQKVISATTAPVSQAAINSAPSIVTNPGGGTDSAAVQNLEKAESIAAADKGNATAEKNAEANVTKAKATVTERTTAAKG